MRNFLLNGNIKNILKRSRSAADYSQEKMARLLKTSRKTISNWENGVTKPPLEMVVKWFEVLNVPALPYYLEMLHPSLFKDISPAADDERIQEALLGFIGSCSSDMQRKLLFFVYGDHGSDIEGIVEMFTAYFHLPLRSRLLIAQQIMTEYLICEAHDELTNMEHIAPDLDTLKASIMTARSAVMARNSAYKLKKGEKYQ